MAAGSAATTGDVELPGNNLDIPEDWKLSGCIRACVRTRNFLTNLDLREVNTTGMRTLLLFLCCQFTIA